MNCSACRECIAALEQEVERLREQVKYAQGEVERLRAALDLVQDSADLEAIRRFLEEKN
jgi:predicted nuclease with TOPRIM domain